VFSFGVVYSRSPTNCDACRDSCDVLDDLEA